MAIDIKKFTENKDMKMTNKEVAKVVKSYFDKLESENGKR